MGIFSKDRGENKKYLKPPPSLTMSATYGHISRRFGTIFSLPWVSSNFAAWIRTQLWKPSVDKMEIYIYIQKITKTCNAMIYIIYICYNKKIYAYHRYSKVMKERCVASLHVHPQPSSWYLSSMYTYMMPKCIAPQNISGRLSAVYEFMGKATFWPSKYFRTSTRRLQSHPQIHLGFIFIMYLFKCI